MKTLTKLTLLLLVLLLPATAHAHDFSVDGIYYNITNDNEVAVTYEGSSYSNSYNDYSGEVSIPATVTYNGTTYSVTSIGNDAFHNCTGLTSVTIPNSVTEIGRSAFYNCSGLTGTLTLPETLSYIGEAAFYWASNIEAVICCAQTPPSWNYLGMFTTNVFNHSPLYVPLDSENAYLADACWGQFVTIIGMPMSKASQIMLNQSQKTMQVGVTSQLTAIVLPESTFNKTVTWTTSNSSVATVSSSGLVTAKAAGSASITATTCDGSNLSATCALTVTSQNTPQGLIISFADANVKTVCIQNWDTNGDGELDIEEANSVTTLDNAFIFNKSISFFDELRYFTGLTSISYNAFNGCTGLKSITIPNNVTVIGQNSFYGCSNLESITIPNNVTEIGYAAFSYCSSLKSITIPSSVTSIGDYAFVGCSGLESIIVETNNDVYDSRDNCNAIIEKANNELIAGCKTTVIPSSVTSIAKYTFSYCDGLTSITIPSSVTCIDRYVFESCTGLKSVTIPSSVTSIWYHAFYGCSSLTNVYSFIQDLSNVTLGDSIFYVGSESFDYSGRTLHVPAGSLAAYQANSKWSECFGTIVEMPAVVLANSIALDQTDAELAKGNILQLSATVMPEDATDKSVTWATSDEAVATVDATGLVTAVASGTATITATTTDGSNLSASCTITVTNVEIEVFEFHIDDMEAEAGSTITIPVLLHNDGVIKGFEFDLYYPEGFAITSYTKTSRLLESNIIRITGNPSNHYYHIAGVKTSLPMILVEAGDGAILNLNLKVPDNASGNYVFWLKNIEIVNANNEGIEQSNTNATFTIHEKSPVLATSIQLDETTATMTENETLQLTATVLPDDATDKSVTWATSDESVATVDRNGLVTAVAPGAATITATTIDGSNLSATCVVTVSVPASANNTLGADAMVIYRGEEKQLAVRMDNDSLITAVQCDIYLPEGISIATEEGDYLIDITPERASSNHVISTNDLPNGAIRLFITSATSKPFKGNSGDLFILNIIAGEDAATGEYGIDLRNVILSDTEAHPYYAPDVTVPVSIRDYIKGDVNIDNTVNVSDYVATANYILELDPHPFLFIAADIDENNTINVSDLVGVANIALNFMGVPAIQHAPAVGEGVMNMAANCMMTAPGRYVVTLDLNNSNAITAFQMDVNLPVGMRLAGAWLSDRASSSHSLEMIEPAGGAYRMLGASMMSKAFAGNEGALLTMAIEGTADGMAIIDGIMLAEPNTTLHQHHALTLSFAPSGVSELTDGLRIYTQGDMIVVESPVATQVQFVLPNGMNIVRDVNAGRNIYNTGLKGIVIVKAGNQVKKFNL